jgi:4-amino-4-deoxychorismate lyase
MGRMHTPLALIDVTAGTVRTARLEEAHFPVEDLAIHRGEGIFETVLVSVEPAAGTPCACAGTPGATTGTPAADADRAASTAPRPHRIHSEEAHFERFQQSAAMLELPDPPRALFDEAVAAVIDRVIAGLDDSVTEFSVRYALSRGLDAHADTVAHAAEGTPTGARGWAFPISVTPVQAAQRTDGVRVITLDRGYDAYLGERAPWLLIGAKTLSYAVNQAAARHAKAQGADEALFVSRDGVVLEGPTANLVVRSGDALLTPDPRAGLLHGTTQRAAFTGAEAAGHSVRYTDLTVEDVLAADGAWLLSSTRTAVPILSLDGRDLAVDAPLTAQLHDWIRAA